MTYLLSWWLFQCSKMFKQQAMNKHIATTHFLQQDMLSSRPVSAILTEKYCVPYN